MAAWLAVSPLGLVSAGSLLTVGCSGPTMAGEDTGKKKEEVKKPPAKRSHTNPNVALTEQEFKELDLFCQATIECVKKRCDEEAIARTFSAVNPTSTWGKTLRDHFVAQDIDTIGRRLGRLVEEEGLHHKSMSCRRVRARFD